MSQKKAENKNWNQRDMDLVVICNALMDHLYNVPDLFLTEQKIEKSTTGLLDVAGQKSLDTKLSNRGFKKSVELGGSGMNTTRAAAKLGAKCAFMGLVGRDPDGFEVKERIETAGISSCLYDSAETATGRCTVLVTPDGERTLQTYLGASSEYETLHAPIEELKSSKVFYFTGYQLMTPNQGQTIEHCLSVANQEGTTVALDVSDPFVVQVCGDKILSMLRQNVQIFFANDLETTALFGDLESGVEFCKQWGIMGVFKRGAKGSLVANYLEGWQQGTITHEISAVKAVDTTGAGDTFSAGFLTALTRGKDLKACLQAGSELSADVVTKMGVILSDEAYQKTKESLQA